MLSLYRGTLSHSHREADTRFFLHAVRVDVFVDNFGFTLEVQTWGYITRCIAG